MSYTVRYFNSSVLDEILSWPVGVLADLLKAIGTPD
jgi:hypothetical protein